MCTTVLHFSSRNAMHEQLRDSSSSAPLQKLILNPVLEVADFDVDAGHVDLPAADAPRHDSGQLPHPVDFADQGAATVALKE